MLTRSHNSSLRYNWHTNRYNWPSLCSCSCVHSVKIWQSCHIIRDLSAHEKRFGGQISQMRKKYIQISRGPLLLLQRAACNIRRECIFTPCVIIKPNKRNALPQSPSSCRGLVAHALLHLRHFIAVLSLRTFSFSPANPFNSAGSSRWFLGKVGFREKFIRPGETCLHSYVIENSSALHIAGRISREINRVREKRGKGGIGILLKIGVCLVDERDLSAISHEIYLPIL